MSISCIFREWFGEAKTGFKKIGSRIVPTKLCQTLRTIAKNGGNDLYNGTLSKLFLQDIKDAGGIITEADLETYKYVNEGILSNINPSKYVLVLNGRIQSPLL